MHREPRILPASRPPIRCLFGYDPGGPDHDQPRNRHALNGAQWPARSGRSKEKAHGRRRDGPHTRRPPRPRGERPARNRRSQHDREGIVSIEAGYRREDNKGGGRSSEGDGLAAAVRDTPSSWPLAIQYISVFFDSLRTPEPHPPPAADNTRCTSARSHAPG